MTAGPHSLPKCTDCLLGVRICWGCLEPTPKHACPATAALDAITAACTEACDNRRRTYPTYGLVSAARIAAIAEEATR